MTKLGGFNLNGSGASPAHPCLRPGVFVSACAHIVFLAGVFGLLHGRAKLVPQRLPGTNQGTHLLTYYSPGSVHAASAVTAPDKPLPPAQVSLLRTPVPPKPAVATTPSAEKGSGSAEQSGLGDGDLNIALQVYFPHPTPNLSSLPRGTKGDVILNAVIDEHGKIAELTLVQGMGAPIDNAVMATVRDWSYTPATRNGKPVVSEQELFFHYERS
jgi:protein TonB